MLDPENPAPRGRPKTISRDHVIDVAMMRYWEKGPTDVSVNEICQITATSKPGLYREFGNDDGLKLAALERYASLALDPLYEILARAQSFNETVENIITYTLQDRKNLDLPNGCLHVAMRTHIEALGETTQKKIKDLRKKSLQNYEKWIERAIEKGEIKIDMEPRTVALYLDSQNVNAMRLQKEGVPHHQIEEILRTAFSVLK